MAPTPSAQGEHEKRELSVLVVHSQVFHPGTTNRDLPSPADDGTWSRPLVRSSRERPSFSIGVVAEAKNESPDVLVLTGAKLSGTVRGGRGEAHCVESSIDRPGDRTPGFVFHAPAASKPTVAAADPLEDGPAVAPKPKRWRAELSDPVEYVWRPGERVRFAVRVECGDQVTADLKPSEIDLVVEVTAVPRFTPQVSELTDADYEMVEVAGSVRVTPRRGRGRSFSIAQHRIERMLRGDAVDRIKSVQLTEPMELSGSGERNGTVELKLPGRAMTAQLVKLPTGSTGVACGSRLLDPTAPTIEWKNLAYTGMSAHSVASEEVPSKLGEIVWKSGELTAKLESADLKHFADAEDESIPKGMRRLESTWSYRLDSSAVESRAGKAAPREREKLAQAVSCKDISLVTDRRQLAPLSRESCAQVPSSDDSKVQLTFLLDRYELPVAFTTKVEGKQRTDVVTVAPLLEVDPR